MLSINQNPISTISGEQIASATAFKGTKKPSTKELRKFQQLLDEQNFIAKMKNPLISKTEKQYIAQNYLTQKWLETPALKKALLYTKAIGMMCLDGIKSIFKKGIVK